MNIELTEQQARSVAAAASRGLSDDELDMNPGDKAAAYRGVAILNEAWQASTGTKRKIEPEPECCSQDNPHPAGSVPVGGLHWVGE